MKAREVGARPVRCYSDEVKAVKQRYQAKCMDCGKVVCDRQKRPGFGMLFAYHRACRHKKHDGALEWFDNGKPMGAVTRTAQHPTTPVYTLLGVAVSEAPKPVQAAKPDLTQADINSMWERLKKLES